MSCMMMINFLSFHSELFFLSVAGLVRVKNHQPLLSIYIFYSSKIRSWNIQAYIENIHNTGQENFKYTAEIN